MTGEPGAAYCYFGAQLQEGLGIPEIKARSNRLLSENSKMLTISYHSFLYLILLIIS